MFKTIHITDCIFCGEKPTFEPSDCPRIWKAMLVHLNPKCCKQRTIRDYSAQEAADKWNMSNKGTSNA